MLQTNPYFRPLPKEMLKHKIFDAVRIPQNEKSAPYIISIDVDSTHPIKNYKNMNSFDLMN